MTRKQIKQKILKIEKQIDDCEIELFDRVRFKRRRKEIQELQLLLKKQVMKITMPLAIYLPRKTKKDKRIAISLSTYRNLHYIVSNQAKKLYKDIVKEKITERNL